MIRLTLAALSLMALSLMALALMALSPAGTAAAQSLDNSKLLTGTVLGPEPAALGVSKTAGFVVLDPSRMANSKQMLFVVIVPGDTSGIILTAPMTHFR